MKHSFVFAAMALATLSSAQYKITLKEVFISGLRGTSETEVTDVTPSGLAIGYSAMSPASSSPRKATLWSFDAPNGIFVGLQNERSSQALAVSPNGMVIGTSTEASGRSKFYRLFGDGSVRTFDTPAGEVGLHWIWESESRGLQTNPAFQDSKHSGQMVRSAASTSGFQFSDDRMEELWTLPGLSTVDKVRKGGMVRGNINVITANRAARGVILPDLACRMEIGSISEFVDSYVGPCDAGNDDSPEIYLRKRPGAVKYSNIVLKKGLNAVNVKLAFADEVVQAFKPLNSPLFIVLADAKGNRSLRYFQGDLLSDKISLDDFVPVIGQDGEAVMLTSTPVVSSPDSSVFAFQKKNPKYKDFKWDLATSTKG